ncbi:MAG: hypothetical protein M1830_010050 [Pleopsidium flavum]|nr:MAG: hypothetical protein M1830_010050 [Pleopsidium flavum]
MAWKKAIEVKVLVNGTPAQEYNDEEEESGGPPIVTRYIEAISGAEFAVQYELKPFFRFKSELMSFEIVIDGKRLDAVVVTKAGFMQQPRGETGDLTGIQRSYGETWSLEKFKFSEIGTSKSYVQTVSTCSDDLPLIAGPDIKDRIAQLGTISLEVHRLHGGVYKEPGNSAYGWIWDELSELSTVSEKALKGHALSHNASLGLPQLTSPQGLWGGTEYLDGEDRPFAIFNFKYRSRSWASVQINSRRKADVFPSSESLQDLRIIPRTPTPVPLEDRPIEELTIEEARELLKRQRERQGSTVSEGKVEIKAERGIKREYEDDEEYNALLFSARPNKLARKLKEGEIINLLED